MHRPGRRYIYSIFTTTCRHNPRQGPRLRNREGAYGADWNPCPRRDGNNRPGRNEVPTLGGRVSGARDGATRLGITVLELNLAAVTDGIFLNDDAANPLARWSFKHDLAQQVFQNRA